MAVVPGPFFEKLIEVRGSSPKVQRRGRLLARLVFITTFLDCAFILYNLWAWRLYGSWTDVFAAFAGIVGLPLLLGIWLLNRRGHCYLAAVFTLTLYFVRISMIANPDRFVVAFWAFILPIILASFILHPRLSFPTAAISAGIYLAVSSALGVSERADLVVFKMVLLLIFALIAHLTASHMDRAIATVDSSEAKYRHLFRNLPVGLYRTSAEGRILDVNPAFRKMFRIPDEQAVEAITAEELYADPASRGEYLSIVEKTHSAEMLMRRLDGAMIWVSDHVSPVYGNAGQILYYEGSLLDITERKLAQQELEYLAITDALTGLSNRGHFFAQAEALFARLDKPHVELAAVMIDLDHFKAVNDRYGHIAGDEVLAEVAHRIQNSLRAGDILGRYGGEELSILLFRVSQEEIRMVADRLRAAVGSTPIKVGGTAIPVTISLGIAALDLTATTLNVLLQRADEALYAAKQSGRNRWVEWHPALGPS